MVWLESCGSLECSLLLRTYVVLPRYEVEFGVADAVVRLTDILKQKAGRKAVSPKKNAAEQGAAVGRISDDGGNGAGSGAGGVLSAQSVSANDVFDAERALDKVIYTAVVAPWISPR